MSQTEIKWAARYRYCRDCKAEGKREIAAWFCMDCAKEEQRQAVVCAVHAGSAPENHYAEEMAF